MVEVEKFNHNNDRNSEFKEYSNDFDDQDNINQTDYNKHSNYQFDSSINHIIPMKIYSN